MSAPQPKSILKKPTASFPAGPSQSHSHPHAHASKPRVGSKLKHTVAVRADNDGPSKSRNTGQTKPKARIADHDDEDEDEDMSAEDEASDDDVSTGDEIERAKEKAGRKKAPTSEYESGFGGLGRGHGVAPSHRPCTALYGSLRLRGTRCSAQCSMRLHVLCSLFRGFFWLLLFAGLLFALALAYPLCYVLSPVIARSSHSMPSRHLLLAVRRYRLDPVSPTTSCSSFCSSPTCAPPSTRDPFLLPLPRLSLRVVPVRPHTRTPVPVLTLAERKAATTADTFGATLTSLLTEPAGGRAGPSKRQRRAGGEEHSKAEADAQATADTAKPSLPLSSSLSAPARGSAPILSLSRTTLPPSRKELSLERKAARILKAEKAEREDRARVKDVVEGWAHPGGGMEFEKGLRKTAQRGGE